MTVCSQETRNAREMLSGYNMPLSLDLNKSYYFYGFDHGTFSARVYYEKAGAGSVSSVRRGYYLTIQECDLAVDTCAGREYATVSYTLWGRARHFSICLKNVTRASQKQARAALDLAPEYIAGYFNSVTAGKKDLNFVSCNAVAAAHYIAQDKSMRAAIGA